MLRELKGVVDIDPTCGEEASLWQYIKDMQSSNPMGDRIKMCQYFGWWHGANTLLPLWTLNLMKAEMVALEMDWLHGKDFMQLPVVKSHVKEADALLKSTSSKITPIEAKLVRTSCRNNVVTQVALLSNYDYRRQLAHMVHFTAPVKKWQGLVVKQCTNCTTTRDWLVSEMGSFFTRTQIELLEALEDQAVLEDCDYFGSEQFAANELEAYQIPKDDEFAQLAGHLVLGMISKRQRRLAWMTLDWPCRQLRALVGSAEARQSVEDLRHAWEVEQFWRRYEPLCPAVQLLLDRSPFRTTAVMQLVHAHEESGWQLSPDIAKLLEDVARGVGSSNVCEHVNNAMKNTRQAKGSMKFRRPQRSMGAAIASRVIDGRYAFKTPEQDCPVSKASVRLDGKTFGRQADAPTVVLKGVASTKSKASWFSPKADNVGIGGADVRLLADAYNKKDPLIVEYAFMSVICDCKYNLVIRRRENRDPVLSWTYLLWQYGGSCGFGWPVTVEEVPNHPEFKCLKFCRKVTELSPITISTWSDVTAVRVTWRGVSYQKQHCPRAGWHSGIRAFVTSAEEPLSMVACRAGFWDLSTSMMQKVSKNIGIDVDGGGTLGTVLFQVCKEVTKMSDSDVMLNCLAARLEATPEQDPEVLEVLLDVDEAASCLMRDEQEKLSEEQKRVQHTRSEVLAFHAEFRDMRQSKGGGGGAKKAKKPAVALPSDMELFEQKDVKKYFPPTNCKVWKSRAANCWHFQVTGWPGEKSRSCNGRGQTAALRLLISEAWYQWTVLEGKPYEAAGVENLAALEELFPDK
jgi:hypothetical protein